MMVEQLVKMLTQLVMVVLYARYWPPDTYGQLMYCYAVVSVFSFFNTLGMENILVKRFVDFSSKRFSYLKHALIIRFSFSILCIAGANGIGFYLVDGSGRLLLFVISLYYLVMPISVFTWLYQAVGRSDLAAIGLIAGSIIGFGYRVVCLLSGESLLVLAWAYSIELAVTGVTYIFLAKKYITTIPVAPLSSARSIKLLKDCFPLLLSGALVMLYMKVDQIMLGKIIGQGEVGIYVAATRLSEAWYFIGLTLIGVYFPKILNLRRVEGRLAYFDAIVRGGRWIVWGGFFLAVITVLIAKPLIKLLYGELYASSSEVLMVSIWAVPFVYLGAIASKVYVLESKQSMILWRSCLGLIINVLLNFWLIPPYGALGGAISTLLSQIVVGVLFNIVGSVPDLFKLQMRLIFPVWR